MNTLINLVLFTGGKEEEGECGLIRGGLLVFSKGLKT